MSYWDKDRYDNLLKRLGLNREKLKDFKIVEKRLTPKWESYIKVILADDRYWDSASYFDIPDVAERIESGGDSRCSGKSLILWLLFPDRLVKKYGLRGYERSEEEEPMGRKIEKGIFSVLKPYETKSPQDLAIYIKRSEEERVKCLIKFRGLLPEEAILEDKEDREVYRRILLDKIKNQPNYIIFENVGEEESPTTEEICSNAEKIVSNIEWSSERGFIPRPHELERATFVEPYLKKCNLEERMSDATKKIKLEKS